MPGADANVRGLGGFVWSIAEILRGDFKQSEYGKVILPFIVLRRLDCILAATKQDVLEAAKGLSDVVDDPTRDMILFAAAGDNIKVYNLSAFTFESLKAQDPGQLHDNLIDYITKFSGNVRDIFLDKFLFTEQLKRLNEGSILWQVFDRFTQIDLHPDRVNNIEMGYLFEDLIRRFSEISNETAGEHFTPREVIRLIVELLIANDDTKLTGKGIIRQVYDPACGTGGMLALTEQALKEFNPSIRVELFGQELERRVLRYLQIGHAGDRPRPRADSLRQHADERCAQGEIVSLHAVQSALRRGLEEVPGADTGRGANTWHGRTLRRGPAAHIRRPAAFPLAHDFEDAERRDRLAHRHRHERLAADYRRRQFRRKRNPPLDAGERLGRGDRRPADRPVLQYRHPDLCVAADQPQADGPGAGRCS